MKTNGKQIELNENKWNIHGNKFQISGNKWENMHNLEKVHMNFQISLLRSNMSC